MTIGSAMRGVNSRKSSKSYSLPHTEHAGSTLAELKFPKLRLRLSTNVISPTAPWLRGAPCSVLALTLLAATPFAVIQASNRDASAPLTFESCTIGDDRAQTVAECAKLAVPLDHEQPDGATLELSIARIAARQGDTSNTAFTILAGGPGQSAIDSYAALSFAFRHIARDHDIVLVDQRGTGASNPLDCPEAIDASASGTRSDDDLSDDELAALSTACRENLEADTRLFTTSVAVRDLETVRQSLDLTHWHLYGISYGTRVAQHYTRRYPEQVASLILDAVVPPDVPLGPEVAPLADRALNLLFERCESDVDCAEHFPTIGVRVRQWFEQLQEEPLEVTIEDLITGGTRQTRFGASELASVVRLMSYNAMTAALLPSMLDAAIEEGHVAPLARQAELQARTVSDTIASGMHLAIVCTEDVPRIPADAAEASANTFLGPRLLTSLMASCQDWPMGVIDDDFHEPLSASVPTLILSGEADPITPPAYGERVAASLTHVQHIVNRAQGHMQAPLGCLPANMAQFISEAANALQDPQTSASPESMSLDTECLERILPPPFFVDPNGPMP